MNCNLYSIWYKNNDNIDIEHFSVKSKAGKVESLVKDAIINVSWYRGISRCHDMTKHEDIVFD